MHTFHGSRVTFNYNSDFSGDVKIARHVDDQVFEIPAKDLIEFVAYCYVSARKLAMLENASSDEILGLESKPKGE